MKKFQAVALGESKRPKLLETEVLHLLQGSVSLYPGNNSSTPFEKGVLHLTSFRLIWISDTYKESMGLFLSLIATVESVISLQPKLVITLKDNQGEFRLGFNAGGKATIQAKLNELLLSKHWELEAQSSQTSKKTLEFSTNRAGVGGLIRQVNDRGSETDKFLEEAFQDLDALMLKAKEIVELTKKYTIQASNTKEENAQISDCLFQLGLPNAVTRDIAGDLYFSELAREIAEFVSVPLRTRHMIQLPELFCLYNRARGTAMISPDDLMEACKHFDSLKLPVQLRRFSSGVLVVQNREQSDFQIIRKINELVKSFGAVTSVDVAREFSISLSLALEQLLLCESQGELCRDESIEGIIFYENLFFKT